MASGGDAGDEWRPAAASTRAAKGRWTDRQTGRQALRHRRQRRGSDERGRLADGRGGLLPCLPVKQATLVEARHGERLPNPAAATTPC